MIKADEIPSGVGKYYRVEWMDSRLPAGLPSGYELVGYEPASQMAEGDPVVLRNRWGHIVYQWPDEYIPDWVDVLNVCKSLKLLP